MVDLKLRQKNVEVNLTFETNNINNDNNEDDEEEYLRKNPVCRLYGKQQDVDT